MKPSREGIAEWESSLPGSSSRPEGSPSVSTWPEEKERKRGELKMSFLFLSQLRELRLIRHDAKPFCVVRV